MKIGIIMSLRKDPNFKGTKAVAQRLKAKGAEVFLEEKGKAFNNKTGLKTVSEDFLAQEADFLLSIGGDGTFLRAAHIAVKKQIPILGINFGRLGYLTELEVSEIAMLDRLVEGNYRIEKRMMLRAEVIRDHKIIKAALALNEAALQNGRISRILEYEVCANGKPVGTYAADGVLFSTPTGSTAYALAAGGPIIDPAVSGLLFVPICAHALAARAVLFSDQTELSVHIPFLRGREAFLSVDGREIARLSENDFVRIMRAEEETRVVRFKELGFHEILNQKLSV